MTGKSHYSQFYCTASWSHFVDSWRSRAPLRWGGLSLMCCFACVCKQMRPLQAAFLHCCSSSSYTPLSDSTAPHSLEDGGLRSTVRWGTLVLCLQLPDRKLRQPGKKPASLETRDLGLCRLGCIFACRPSWRMQYPVDASLSPGLSAASPGRERPGVSVCMHVCVNVYYVLTCGFHVFWEEMSSAMSKREIWWIETIKCILCWCWSGEQPVFCCCGGLFVCREALWKLLTHSCGKFNFSAGDLDTWCVCERMDTAWGLPWYYDIMILILGLKEGLNLKFVHRKDIAGGWMLDDVLYLSPVVETL